MRIEEALVMACNGHIVEIGSIGIGGKQIKASGNIFNQFEQRQFISGKWTEWVDFMLSIDQITSSEWCVFEEEKQMGFTEALLELMKRDDGSIMYQSSKPQWQYFFDESGPAKQLFQRRIILDSAANRRDCEYEADMITGQDWVVKSAPKGEKEGKKEGSDCDHANCGLTDFLAKIIGLSV